MIQRKLLFYVHESIPWIKRNVVYQWIGLICNICATFCFCMLLFQKLDVLLCFFLLLISICLRWIVNGKAVEMSYQASRIVKEKLRRDVYKKLYEIGSSYLDRWSTAEIVQVSTEGVEQLETYFAQYVPQFFYSLLAPFTLFLLIVWMDWKAALILLICVPLIPLSIVFVQKFAKRLLHKYWGQYTQLGDSFLENLQGLTTLKIYEADQAYHQKMNEESEKFRKITMRVLTMQLNSISVMDLIAYGGSALGIFVALLEFHQSILSPEQTLFIILISAEFFIPMRQLGSYFHIAMNGVAASDKIFSILESPQLNKKAVQLETTKFSARNLSFSYDNKNEVLHSLNFTFSQGLIGFVGESGCGKSTLVKVLSGRYPHYSGMLMLDDKDVKDIDIRKECVTISLESYLFAGTLQDNLMMANPLSSEEDMWTCLDQVCITDFVLDRGGLDFVIEEGGKNLSGGQKQRLCLARALLKHAKIYIFDEATSNIDVESEKAIMNVIDHLAKDHLVICISHRLANLNQARCIYCMQDGKIVGAGTHQSLLLNCDCYEQMWKTQQSMEMYGGSL